MFTYPVPEPEDHVPPAKEIVALVEANDDRLDGLIEDIASSVRQSVDVNERTLKPVYQDLVYHIQGLVKLSDHNLAFVGTPLLTHIRANVNAQKQILQPILQESVERIFVHETEDEEERKERTSVQEIIRVPEEIVRILDNPLGVDHKIKFEFEYDGIKYTQPPEGIVCGRNSAYNPETGLCEPIDVNKIVVVRREEEREIIRERIPEGGRGTGEQDETTEYPYTTSPPPPPPPVTPEEPAPPPTPAPLPAPRQPPSTFVGTTISPLDYQNVQFCSDNVCKSIEARLYVLENSITQFHEEERNVFVKLFEYIANLGAAAINASFDAIARFVPGDTLENMRATYLNSIGEELVFFHTAINYIGSGNIGTIERPQVTAVLASKLGYAHKLEKDTGVPTAYLSTNLQYLFQYLNPQYIPSQDEVDLAYLHNEINNEVWECWTKSHGNLPDCREKVIQAKSSKYTLDTLLRLYYRGLFKNDEEFRAYCNRIGFINRSDIELNVRAFEQVPTPSELVHYTIRDAFDTNKLGRKEMLDELKEQTNLRALFRAQGYEKFVAKDDNGVLREFDNVELAWISSYYDVSPTQSYEMLHRLRPGRNVLYKQHIPNRRPEELRTLLPGADIVPDEKGTGSYIVPKPVTMYEVAKNLKEHDYNPVWRDKLAAISYRVIGRIDLRRLYNEGVLGSPVGEHGFTVNLDGTISAVGEAEKELVERYLDFGYNQTDATLLAYYTAKEYDKARNEKKRRKIVPKLCRAYQVGILSKEDLINSLRNAFIPESQINEIVSECELDFNVRITTQHIQAIRRMFLDGEIDENQAVKALGDIGIAVPRIWDLLRLWRAQLRRINRNLTVSTLCEWYAMGIIERKEFENRLKNMKYLDDDIRRIIRHCELKEYAKSRRLQERLAAEAIKREERDKLIRVRIAERMQRESERQIKRRNTGKTLSNMRTWLKAGTITPDEVYTSLIERGYTPQDAIRWIASVIPGYTYNNKKEGSKNE